MERAGGYAMLFGLVLVAVGLFRAFSGIEDAVAALVTGGAILLAGFGLATRPGRAPARGATREPLETPAARRTPDKPPTAWFSVIESIEETVLDDVEAVLATDPRITRIASESGRYYSNPDRDDLPEWFALRCECAADQIGQVMADAERLIAERLGEAAASRVQIRRY